MSAIGPGSILICTYMPLRAPLRCPLPKLVVGATYECEEVCVCLQVCPRCGKNDGLILRGYRDPDWCYCPCGFTPAGRRGMFDGLLRVEPTKQEARETADALTTMFTPEDWAKKMFRDKRAMKPEDVPDEWRRAYEEAYPR